MQPIWKTRYVYFSGHDTRGVRLPIQSQFVMLIVSSFSQACRNYMRDCFTWDLTNSDRMEIEVNYHVSCRRVVSRQIVQSSFANCRWTIFLQCHQRKISSEVSRTFIWELSIYLRRRRINNLPSTFLRHFFINVSNVYIF